MIEKVTAFTEGCEEITEELTRSAGMIVTKITPLLAPVASGLCILFAFYDGGGRMLTGKVEKPYLVSFLAGLILFVVVEGINFAATFTRDRGEKLKGTHANELSFLNLNGLVRWCFVLTVATVAMLETIPGATAWYYGEIAGSDLGFRVGILILPFFSKMGANIFSVSMLLDALEGTSTARRNRRLQDRREAAELEIEIDSKRKEAALKLAQHEAEHKQKLEIERQKAEAKIAPKSTPKSVKSDEPESVQSGVVNTNLLSTEQRLNTLIDTLLNTGWLGVKPLADALKASRTTVYKDLDTLMARGLLHIVRDVDEKIVDVQVIQISMEIPHIDHAFVNGNGVVKLAK